MDKEKALSNLKMALGGDTRKTWQYALSQLKVLGHVPPQDICLESWTIQTAKKLVD